MQRNDQCMCVGVSRGSLAVWEGPEACDSSMGRMPLRSISVAAASSSVTGAPPPEITHTRLRAHRLGPKPKTPELTPGCWAHVEVNEQSCIILAVPGTGDINLAQSRMPIGEGG